MFGRFNRMVLSLGVLCMVAQAGYGGLVGHWKLDDGSGTVAADATGNGHDGALVNNPTWVTGHMNGALQFDGSSQKVDIPYSEQINPADAFSVSVWAYPYVADSTTRSPLTSRDDYPQRGYVLYESSGNAWQFWTGTGEGWSGTTGSSVIVNEWTLITATQSDGQSKLYINGNLVGQTTAAFSPNTAQVLRIGAGASELDGKYFFQGKIDDVRVYDRALIEEEVPYLFAGKSYPFAIVQNPADDSTISTRTVTLQWSSGELATSHNVYFGEDEGAVTNATTEDTDLFLGNTTANELAVSGTGTVYPNGLTPGVTYYWRIDEVNDDEAGSPWKGEVWSFTVLSLTAWDPSPADGVEYILVDQDLSWSPGQDAIYYAVYFGEDFNSVSTSTTGTFTVNTSYDPGTLAFDTTYYWRIDSCTMSGTTYKGTVWSFQTAPEITISDPNLLAWWKLDEGVGENVLDWSGHEHHGTLGGNPQWVGGVAGTALSFDGQDDYVGFGTPSDLYLPKIYSYCVWFRVGTNISGNSGSQYLLCIGSRSDLLFGVADSVGVNGDLMLHYYDAASSFHAVGTNRVAWSADQWHLVVATKNAAGHKVYLDGELVNSDSNVNEDKYNTSRIISLGARAWTSPQVAFFNGSIDEVRIYDKSLTGNEIQDLLVINPRQASEPTPVRDGTVDIRDADSLSWIAGDMAVSHDVYFGTDRADVAAADKNSPEFRGNQTSTSFSLDGLVTFGGGDYYWRIDEVASDGDVQTGDVWKFTVPAYLLIEDFESYDDSDNCVYYTWLDGYVVDTEGSHVGTLTSVNGTFNETTIIHGGSQSMPFIYNNTISPYYSEAERDWSTNQDWTAEDVDTLTLYFYGATGNGSDALYVALADSTGKVVVITHEDPDAVRTLGWTEWNIPLSEFTGLKLDRIRALYIGLGSRSAPTAGGSGVVYFDDIRLTRAE